MKDKEYWVRQSAATVLARIGEFRPVEPDTATMAQPVYYRRQAALEALLTALSDFDPELRVAAAAALGRLGQPAATRPLEQTLKDEDPRVQSAAAQALQLIQGRATSETTLISRRDPFQQ